eukprot:NODE_2830_length_1032_cov_11.271617_g2369_i0.p1 GENE.NODE_2830_length_1032_cov_11.271617_g2369_i0~~NODE_2830_length_1032_cov_11.271617_g2369_i0.p1  ORF type:complete len:343 (+),score=4.80 NODE_2830_length_1032_cov_11.271617_g2369_i0:134-1030(+)
MGVIRPLARSEKARLVNRAFTVPKSEPNLLRFIVDPQLNQLSGQPWWFFLPSPIEVVDLAFAHKLAWASDFVSWFYQFPLPRHLQNHFAFRACGGMYAMKVLPQGWKWAPVFGHLGTCTLARVEPFNSQGAAQGDAAAWLDNVALFANSDEALRLRVDEFLGRCRDVGARIGDHDPPDLSKARHLDFVGLSINLEDKWWALKPSWREKAEGLLRELLSSPEERSLREWWRGAGLAGWACRALDIPLVALDPLIEWTSRMSSLVEDGAVLLDSPVSPWAGARRCFDRVLALIAIPCTLR